MNFEIVETTLPEVKIIKGKRFHDERGYFSETYKITDFAELGLPEFVQDNLSESSAGVIRGLHWQEDPFGQGKLVQCIAGSILDVAVDIRKSSPNFGKHVEVELNESELKFLWIPSGFAHGFESLLPFTKVMYKVTNYWNKESEMSINPLDPEIKINWRLSEHILSYKDRNSPKLMEI